MKFADDLNRTPHDAFGGAIAFGSMGLVLLANGASTGRISVGVLAAGVFFLTGAVLLFRHGRQMQGAEKQMGRSGTP